MEKAGRNDPCPCGSGKKYKKCCLPMQQADQRAAEQQTERVVRAGKLDEAEGAARDLLGRFPVHDGWDRLGMVYEARGENREPADCYRKVSAFIREHPDNYDPAFEDKFVKLIAKLDPRSPG